MSDILIDNLKQSFKLGLSTSAIIIFLGVSSDGWGQWLGCSTQIWKLFRGWLLLTIIISLASFVVALWTDFNDGGGGWFGQNNDDDDDPPPRRPSSGQNPASPKGGNPPARPPSQPKKPPGGGGNPPGNPPSQPKKPPGGGGNPPGNPPSPKPSRPSPCPSPSPQRPIRRPRTPTPEPEEPQGELCKVCGYAHAGGSHEW